MESKKISELEQYNGSADGFMVPGVADGETQKANLGTLVEQKAEAAGFLKPSGLKTINGESIVGSGNVDIDMKNPFKGWYDDLAALQAAVASPKVGDYAYIKGENEGDDAAVYECATAGTWTDSGRTVDTSNVQTFGSGQALNAVKIMDENGFEDAGAADVLSAEAGANLKENKLDKVEKSTEEIWTEVGAVGDYPHSNTYLNLSAVEGTLSGFTVLKCAVNAGDRYYITGGTGSGDGSTFAAFYNSEDSLISGSKIDSGVANVRKTRYEVTAPSNAAYIKIQGAYGFNPLCETKEIVETIVSDNQAQLNSIGNAADLNTTEKTTLVGAINEVDFTTKAISEVYVSKNLFNKNEIIGNKVVATDGALTTVSSWTFNKCTGLIPVEPNKFYYISGDRISQGRNIRCLASNGTTPMKILKPDGTEYSTYAVANINTQFLTPATAAYVQFNTAVGNEDYTNTAMIELVGDTYNPDFVPSEYEEYGETTYKIKPEALPEGEKKYDVPKVLLIGSSHGMNTVSQLPWMFYHQGFENIVVGNVYIGSFMIQELAQRIVANQTLTYQEFNNSDDNPAWGKNATAKLMSQLLNMEWDVISLQRSASDDETWTTSQATSFEFVIKYISDYCKTNKLKAPRVIMNTGFADRNAAFTTTESIMNTAKQAKQELGIEYYPTAMALANARNTWMKDLGKVGYKYLCYDSQHLDYGIGCWVASACLYEAVMRPLGGSVAAVNGYGTQAQQAVFNNTAGSDGNYTEPTQKTMEIAKSCVLAAFIDDTSLNNVLASKYQYENQVEIFANWIRLGGTDANTKCVATGGNYSISFEVSDPVNRQLNSVSVEMGGTDITSSVYDSTNKTINITNVDGDIRIIIKTV